MHKILGVEPMFNLPIGKGRFQLEVKLPLKREERAFPCNTWARVSSMSRD